MTGLLLVHFLSHSLFMPFLKLLWFLLSQLFTQCISLLQTSPSLLTPVPSLKWSCRFLCVSQYHLCLPLSDTARNTTLNCFPTFFLIPPSLNIFKSSQSCYAFYFITQNLSLLSPILSLLILPCTSNLLSSQLSGFFYHSSSTTSPFLSFPFYLISHWHQHTPISSVNSSSHPRERDVFLVLMPSQDFSSWEEKLNSLLLVVLRPNAMSNYQTGYFNPIEIMPHTRRNFGRISCQTYEL